MIKNKTRKVLNYYKNKLIKNKINLKKYLNKINKGKNIQSKFNKFSKI